MRFVVFVAVAVIFSGAVRPSNAESFQASAPFADSLLGRLVQFLPDSVRQYAIAVFPLIDETGDRGLGYNAWVSEYFAFRMRHSDRFGLVDHSKFRHALRELDLSPRDPVDDSTAREVCRTTRTGYFFIGTLSQVGGKYRIEARIVNTESGIIVTGAGSAVREDELEELKRQMLQGKANAALGPVLGRSMLLPGWGQIRRERLVPGIAFPAAYVAALGVFGYLAVPMSEAKSEYEDYHVYLDNSPRMKRDLQELINGGIDSAAAKRILVDRGDSLYDIRTTKIANFAIAGAVAAGIWGINLLDVAITGIEPKRQFRLYFSGNFRDETAVTVCWNF